MRRPAALLICSIWLCTIAQAQVPACLSVRCIPDSLKLGAHAVMRLDEEIVVYQAPGKYRKDVHEVVTVLDDSGAAHFHPSLPSERFYKVSSADVRILDANGQELRHYTRKDFETHYYDDGYSLATDANYIQLDPLYPAFPCTIDVKYSLDVSSSITQPSWMLVQKGSSVERSFLAITLPKGMELLFKKENGAHDPVISVDNNQRTWTWKASGLSARGVMVQGAVKRSFPRLELVVTPFQYGGYRGEIKDWASFGKWFWDLYQEPADPFTPKRREEIRAVFKDAGSYRQVVEYLYKYMQKNMRYVSIQLGIGGQKPFPVAYVDQNKYGDCKALTNYMRYLLLEAGIKSYPALINAGVDKEPIDTSFTNDHFNHVILCVPLRDDTCWLECTDKYSQAGELGSFTENRYALLLTEQGGRIISTPKSKALDNVLATKVITELDADGSGKAEVEVACSGDFLQSFQFHRSSATREEWKEYLVRETGLREPDASLPLDATAEQGSMPGLKVAYDKIPVVNSGGKMFLPARLVTLTPGHEWPVESERPVKSMARRDTTIYKLPAGHHPQALPAAQNLEISGGRFHTSYHFDEGTRLLTITAEMTIQLNSPKANQTDWSNFLKSAREEPSRLLIIVHD